MPLQFTAAHSSSAKITKMRNKSSPARRSSSTQTPISRSKASPAKRPRSEASLEERLPDNGPVAPLPSSTQRPAPDDVPALLSYILENMFTPVPASRSGMSSTRTAELLQFRARLPPLVALANVHAVSASPSATDRRVAELVRRGVVRRVRVPGRGKGGVRAGAEGEALVRTDAWADKFSASTVSDGGMSEETKNKYTLALKTCPTLTVPLGTFSPDEARQLIAAGWLTSSSGSSSSASTVPGTTFLSAAGGSLTGAGSRFASGSMAAVGGQNATLDAGGGGSGGRLRGLDASSSGRGQEYVFTLPSTGPYLKLLAAAQTYLLHLLSRSKYREAPLSLLRERWDSAEAPQPANPASTPTQAAGGGFVGDGARPAPRGEASASSTAILPGRTKKWRSFYGLSFDFVLAEAVGAGAVECFDTGAVGVGVRAS